MDGLGQVVHERLIEVNGLARATSLIRLTPNEKRVVEHRCDCYWLYVVTNCASAPVLYEQRKDPAAIDWHEVTSVAHDHVTVDALKHPAGFSDRPQAPLAGTP